MTNTAIRTISNVAILAGFFCVGVWGWSVVHRLAYEDRENQAFDEQLRDTRPAPPPAAAPAPQSVIGRLVIPRLRLRAMVREGTDARTLDVALGHVAGTALPGQNGNIAIAGHRDTLFQCLRNVAKGDLIVFQTTHGTYTYHVDRIGVVTPRDVGVLAPGSYSALTLVTCYPFRYLGAAPDRLIVKARLVSAR
jgi:sortase A